MGSEQFNNLLYSFYKASISSGVAKGNSYFIINLDDQIICSSYGKFAIKTQNFAEQINYIASMCGENAQKFCSLCSVENLLKLSKESSSFDIMDVLIKGDDGLPKWYKVKALYAMHPDSEKNYIQLVFVDVDSVYREAELIKYNASHDELTQLLNKRSFKDMAVERMAKINNNYWKALIFIDIDDFKNVNDKFGHIVGDRVLRDVALGIKKSFREGDVVGRIGGDEFMVLFSAPSLYSLYSRLNLINANIKQNAQLQDISISFGVVVFFDGNADFSRLYYLSDKAMYEAKQNGKMRYCILDENSNLFLNEVIEHFNNEKVVQIMKLKLTDYIFASSVGAGVTVNYVSPKLSREVFGNRQINTLDSLKEVLSEADYLLLANLLKLSQSVKDVVQGEVNIKGEMNKVFVCFNGGKYIISLSKSK